MVDALRPSDRAITVCRTCLQRFCQQQLTNRQDSNEIFVVLFMSPIIAGYGLDDRGIVVRFPVRQGIFGYFKHSVRIRSPQSLLFSVYCGRFPKGLKRPQSAVKHITFSARLKINREFYPPSFVA